MIFLNRLPPEGFAIIEDPNAFDERTSMMFWIDAFVSPDTGIFTRAEKPGRVLIERLLGEKLKSDDYLGGSDLLIINGSNYGFSLCNQSQRPMLAEFRRT